MFNHKFFKSILLTSLISSGTVMSAENTTVNGGTVHFKGEVVSAACAVDAGTTDQTVQMGQVRSASLSEKGKTSSSVPFNIVLTDCDSSMASKASVSFSGVSVVGDNTALALANSAAGSADNVAIQITDSKGKALAFDGTVFSEALTLVEGKNTIPLHARYIATGKATAGIANADANFNIQFQ